MNDCCMERGMQALSAAGEAQTETSCVGGGLRGPSGKRRSLRGEVENLSPSSASSLAYGSPEVGPSGRRRGWQAKQERPHSANSSPEERRPPAPLVEAAAAQAALLSPAPSARRPSDA